MLIRELHICTRREQVAHTHTLAQKTSFSYKQCIVIFYSVTVTTYSPKNRIFHQNYYDYCRGIYNCVYTNLIVIRSSSIKITYSILMWQKIWE